MSSSLAILVPVWHQYQWLAPFTQRTLDAYWPGHPPVWYCGLDTRSSGSLPVLDLPATIDRGNWCQVLREGVLRLKEKGIRQVYLIAEEHVPLAPCHVQHLNTTLPALMASLPAVYISLMGWDNRRYTSRSPVLDAEHFRLKHLTSPGDPRFHLHPALWDIDALLGCCELALADTTKNGSAWLFEKVNDKPSAHSPAWRNACYQISAEAMALNPPDPASRLGKALERFVFHKLMALYPLIPHRPSANAYARAMGFDDFLCAGPYPMFYSGIMAKGGINFYLRRYLLRSAEGRAFFAELHAAREAASAIS